MFQIVEKTGKYGAICICSKCTKRYEVRNRYDAKKSRVGDMCETCKTFTIAGRELNQSNLQAAFNYDPMSGLLTHRFKSLRHEAGDVVGTEHNEGYVETTVFGHRCLVHRLIFMYMTGEMPEQVDHINHVRGDNRWCNLRAASNQENHKNESLSSNSTTGITGVSKHMPTGQFRAYINVNYKQIHLGLYDTLEEAMSARVEANKKHSYHVNHGK